MDYQSVIDTLIACGLASRLFNAFVGMVTGKERVRF